jgi:hypothetical protein
MAKRRSSKKTYAQKVAGFATVGLPSPVQKIATSKLGSWLFLLLIPILIASGVITISFANGLPSVTFNKDRAVTVGRELETEAFQAAERIRERNNAGYR